MSAPCPPPPEPSPWAPRDEGTRPQDDLWGHVNNAWLASGPIPADRARWGLSEARRAEVIIELGAILTDAAVSAGRAGPPRPAGVAEPTHRRRSAEEAVVGALYAALTDDAARERRGAAALAADLALAAAPTDAAGVLRAVGALMRGGVPGFLAAWVLPSTADPARPVLLLEQDGLTLGDQGAYAPGPGGAPSPPLRTLRDGAPALLAACGVPEAAAVAAQAIDLEVALAAAHWDRHAAAVDADSQTELSLGGLDELMGLDPGPLWAGLGLGAPEARTYGVAQPSMWAGVGALLRDRPVAQWRSWLAWQVARARATLLHAEAAAAHHALFGAALAGQQSPPTPLRRAVEAVQTLLPWPLARLYVDRYVTPEAIERATAMTRELQQALADALTDASWLAPATRVAALAKLATVQVCVGRPDSWRDCADLTLDPTDAVGSARLAAAWTLDGELALLDHPVDRRGWGPPPYVVNTFYNPRLHQVCLTGAYLAGLPEDPDEAFLFARLGSIVAHELGHAFDSRGSSWDEDARLRDWWTPADRAEFAARVDRVVAQVDGYRPRGLPEDAVPSGVDGRFVAFECVAELIGLEVAWRGYARRLGGAPTPAQARRFFLAKAYGRRGADRPQTAAARLRHDPHPPFELFANLARNLDAFHDAFATRPGDGMWLAPPERVHLYP